MSTGGLMSDDEVVLIAARLGVKLSAPLTQDCLRYVLDVWRDRHLQEVQRLQAEHARLVRRTGYEQAAA